MISPGTESAAARIPDAKPEPGSQLQQAARQEPVTDGPAQLVVFGIVLLIFVSVAYSKFGDAATEDGTNAVVAIFLMMLGGILYFLPSIIASRNHHPRQTGIALLNIFLGWTLLGWVGALVWAVTLPEKPRV
jgi:drug/metabolite transporter (DMT)-like permease